jgi:hypothetical protein
MVLDATVFYSCDNLCEEIRVVGVSNVFHVYQWFVRVATYMGRLIPSKFALLVLSHVPYLIVINLPNSLFCGCGLIFGVWCFLSIWPYRRVRWLHTVRRHKTCYQQLWTPDGLLMAVIKEIRCRGRLYTKFKGKLKKKKSSAENNYLGKFRVY